jgi:hypothetical protein
MGFTTARWQLVNIENAEAYHTAIHTPEEYKAKLRLLYGELKTHPEAYIEELTVDKAAGKVQRVVFIKGEKKRDSGLIDLNQEIEHKAPDGRTVKGRISLEGENKLLIHEKGDGFETNIVLVLNGDELTATMTAGGVVCTEKYKRI